jgi:hypothetical protein
LQPQRIQSLASILAPNSTIYDLRLELSEDYCQLAFFFCVMQIGDPNLGGRGGADVTVAIALFLFESLV